MQQQCSCGVIMLNGVLHILTPFIKTHIVLGFNDVIQKTFKKKNKKAEMSQQQTLVIRKCGVSDFKLLSPGFKISRNSNFHIFSNNSLK